MNSPPFVKKQKTPWTIKIAHGVKNVDINKKNFRFRNYINNSIWIYVF